MNRSSNRQQIVTCSPLCLLGLLGLTLFASPVAAQVFDSGPSDSTLFDTVINVPPDPNIPSSFDDNASVGGDGLTTQLNIFGTGSVGDYFDANAGSEVNISGGEVGNTFEAHTGSEVNISGGSVASRFQAMSGSEVTISGGSVSGLFFAQSGSRVSVSGGALGGSLSADSGSEINISGGSINLFTARLDSVVNISGGSVRFFSAESGSDVELTGGEFQLNGTAFLNSTILLSEGDVFTGTLTDGSAFIFSELASEPLSDNLSNFTLTSGVIPTLNLSPIVVSTADPNLPSGLRAEQTLTLLNGGVLGGSFEAVDATLNVEGGSLGEYAGAANSVVNISGGSVGQGFNAFSGSVVDITGGTVGPGFNAFSGSVSNITGGSVGDNFEAHNGSEVNISGGTVGEQFNAFSGSVVNISGGSVDVGFDAESGSEVNISGGVVGDFFEARSGSVVNISGGEVGRSFNRANSVVNISGGAVVGRFIATADCAVNLFGSDFALNGVPLDSLTIDDAFTIVDRGDVTLSGLFADGSAFSFELNSSLENVDQEEDLFSADSTLTVTLVSTVVLGDVNVDGVATFADIPWFIGKLQSGDYCEEADLNQDGVVNFSDIAPFIELLSGG